jgi:hypothetical protein
MNSHLVGNISKLLSEALLFKQTINFTDFIDKG